MRRPSGKPVRGGPLGLTHKVRFGVLFLTKARRQRLAVLDCFGIQSKLFSDPIADGNTIFHIKVERMHFMGLVFVG